MTKQIMTFITLVVGMLIGLPTFAQQPSNSYNRGYNTNYNNNRRATYVSYGAAYRNEIGASTTLGEISSASSTTVINLSTSYKNMVTRSSAFGGILNIASMSGNGNNNTYFGLWGTYTYFINTNWNTANSLFIEAALGLADTALANQGHANVIKSDRQFSWMGMIGKNFPIFDKLRFSPKVGVQKIGDTDMAILLIPVNLTLAF